MATRSSKSTKVAGMGQPLRWTDTERVRWVPFLFLGSVLLYAARGALPITVVEMSQEFEWNKRTSGFVLSAFFWGYSFTQIIGGQLADKHGGELVLWVFGVGWSSTVLLIALTASVSDTLVIVANFINGLCQGCHFPAIIALMSSRISDERRSFVYGLIASGANIGSILCGVLGYIFLFNHGWEYLMLTVGLSGITWSFVFKWMSDSHEKKVFYRLLDGRYQKNSTDINEAISADLEKLESTCVEVPWRILLRQAPILAMFFSNFGQSMFFHSMMAWAPTYFHETFPQMQNKAWIYNVTPWISKGLANILSGFLAKRMIEKGSSVTSTRKWMEGVASIGVVTPLLILAIFGTTPNHFILSLSMFNLSFFFHGFEIVGSSINSTDLVPSFSGILYGMMNTGGSIAGILGVSIISHILHTTDSWASVFLVIAGIVSFGFIVYMLFGSGKRLLHVDS